MHDIDFHGIHESLFILQNICMASEPFCVVHRIGAEVEGSSDYDWHYYFGYLKPLLCDHLLKLAVKVRTLQDFLRAHPDFHMLDAGEIDFGALDERSLVGLNIGQFHVGSERLGRTDIQARRSMIEANCQNAK